MTGGVCDDDGDARESLLLLQIPKKLEPSCSSSLARCLSRCFSAKAASAASASS